MLMLMMLMYFMAYGYSKAGEKVTFYFYIIYNFA